MSIRACVAANENGDRLRDRRSMTARVQASRSTDLDNVDLGRQVRRHFEADFLLAHCGLGPGLHGISSLELVRATSKRDDRPGAKPCLGGSVAGGQS